MDTPDTGGASEDERPDLLAPLVDAKISAPSVRRDVVNRQRIMDALDEGADARLMVLEAPAGYGKSTAIRSWCATQDAGLMWVTLDSGDDDPTRLWTYIANAVERIRPGLARSVLQRLEVPGGPIEHAVNELMTVLGRSRKPAILVLDDFHTVTGHDSVATIDLALRHLPDNVRVLIGTRVDPPLAIPRMRAAQQVTELRASDLAFTVAEAHTLLVEHNGLALASGQVEVLVERTQGWVAMLVLTGIWLRRVDDLASGVSSFGGEQRFVADYLSSEVLAALDDERRGFLRVIAVLGQFTPALCDAVVERTGSAAMIDELERSGLFVSRLDHGWFRIHPLFAEYARLELETAEPGAATRIHDRAARWLAPRWPVDAMAHASAAGEPAVVAQLLAEQHISLIGSGAGRTLLRWASTLPDDILIGYPEVAAAAAITSLLMCAGTMERRRYLGLVDRAIAENRAPADGYVAAAGLIGRTLALDGGVAEAVRAGRRAVDLTGDGLDALVGGALSAYGRALYFAGALDEARDAAVRALEHPDAMRRLPTLIHARATLALVAVEDGRLSSARAHTDQAKDHVGRIGVTRSWLGANVAAAEGTLLLAEGRAVEACRQFAIAEHSFRDDVPNVHHTWLLLQLARAYARRGRLDDASEKARIARDSLAELPDAGILPALVDATDHDIAQADKRAHAGDLLAAPSDAELTVLRLIADDLSVREIGARLFVSANTVRTHRRALYRKLGVHSRDEAIARAAALELLAEDKSPG